MSLAKDPLTAEERAEPLAENLPPEPLTVEGASVLHQVMRFRQSAWRALDPGEQDKVLAEAVSLLEAMESGDSGQSAVFSLFGHKGDLLFLHYRNSFDELKRAELRLAKLRLTDFLEPATSYLSVVELGLYDSSARVYNELARKGIDPHSPEWNTELESVLAIHRKAMQPRLYPRVPPRRYICFYPMDRKRGEEKNWYQVPMSERQRMMREHGAIGRRYAGDVQQIISGSIGFDDWEWGVDLFADDPLVFKKLIYEMRFDEVSAVYALFGSFYVGIRCPASSLGALLSGELPEPLEQNRQDGK
jgi:chlorite dismutase